MKNSFRIDDFDYKLDLVASTIVFRFYNFISVMGLTISCVFVYMTLNWNT